MKISTYVLVLALSLVGAQVARSAPDFPKGNPLTSEPDRNYVGESSDDEVFAPEGVAVMGARPQSKRATASVKSAPTNLGSDCNLKFAISLYQKALEANPDRANANVLLSPFGYYRSLDALELGAEGDTKSQLLNALGGPKDDAARLERASAFYKSFEDASELNVATGLAYGGALASKEYREKLSALPNVELIPIAPGTTPKDANSLIDQWTRKKTNDLIGAPDIWSLNSKCALVDAVAFNGKWESPFENETPGIFNGCDATFMTQTTRFRYAAQNDAIFVELPYANRRFSFMIVMPTNDDFNRVVDPECWRNLRAVARYAKLELSMPSFEIQDAWDLKPIAAAQGVVNLFSDLADLSGIFGSPDFFVENIRQNAVIKVDKEGTVAAAATVSAIAPMGLEETIPVKIDRPFLFAVVDSQTDSTLFFGRFNAPKGASAQAQPAESQPTQAQPAESQPAQEQPAESQPTQEQPAESQPTQEQPAESQPAQEQPAESQPTQEQPAESQPAQEQPAESQPAQEQPAEGANPRVQSECNLDFAFRFYKAALQTNEVRADDNVVLSPFGYYRSFDALELGSEGDTKSQLLDALGGAKDDAARLERASAFYKSFENVKELAAATGLAYGGELVSKEYREKLNALPNVELISFAPGMSAKETFSLVDQWARKKTNDLIGAPGEVWQETPKFTLVDVVAFKGEWQNKFSQEYQDKFNGADATFMTQLNSFRYAAQNDAIFVELPYSNPRFLLRIVMPTNDDLDRIADVDLWNNLNAAAKDATLQLSMPMFEIRTGKPWDLKKVAVSQGVKNLFGNDADLPGIFGSDGFFVNEMLQSAMIKVDKEGTDAIAVTMTSFKTKSIVTAVPVKIDRPFLFALVDAQTDSVLFLGRCVKP